MKTTTLMKSPSLYRFALLAVIMLMSAWQLKAQVIKTAADLVGTSTQDGKTIICSESANFTLKSSTVDPTDNTTPYKTWTWSELGTDGTPGALPSNAIPSSEKLTVTGAVPGWHTYQVIASTGDANCPSEPVTFTVFVLPPLTVAAAIDQANNLSLTYCAESGAPTDPAKLIKMDATAGFPSGGIRIIQGLRDLKVTDFELNYKWIRVNLADNSTTDVATNTTGTYTISDPASTTATEVKKYGYKVQVSYAVKSTCAATEATVMKTGTTPAEITVTPKPGKPVITIE